MNRRRVVSLLAVAIMVGFCALAAQKKESGPLLLLQWAEKASGETPPLALLIELGVKDTEPSTWNGRATVSGARVVHREGYRFLGKDRLQNPDAWQASSHRPVRLPPRNPALTRLEGINSVGIVLHLTDIKENARLLIETDGEGRGKATVALADVLAGKPQPLWGGTAVVRLISTATPLTTAPTEDDFPAACYDRNGVLWVAYVGYHVKDDTRRTEQPQLDRQPKNFKDLYTPAFRDQVFVQYYLNGRWSKSFAVTDDSQDIVRCAIAGDGDGGVWVAYSANRDGNHDIYARKLDLNTPEAVSHPSPNVGAEQRLTKGGTPDLGPVMCTGQDGQVHLACQTWNAEGRAGILWLLNQGEKWSEGFLPTDLGERQGTNAWSPSLAAGPTGPAEVGKNISLTWDVYARSGDYDVTVARFERGFIKPAASSKYEARPSLAFDPQGRLWIAYEEGPELWGKDYGALDGGDGNPLYNTRSVRVVCLVDGKLMKPAADLPTASIDPPRIPFERPKTFRFERDTRYAYPKIGIDGKGRVWLTYREKFGTRYSSHPGSYWLTFARRLEGDRWSEPIEIHHSDGLLDHRPVLLPHKSGGLLVVHNTDGRYTTPNHINNDLYISYLNLPGEPIPPKLVPHEPGKKQEKLIARQKKESEAVDRMHDHRVDAGGKKLHLLRGEFHRHTEISWDGGPDGSLEDMFRYGIDAAQFDWIGNGDHDNGAGREYTWWLTQKFTDAYHVANRFTPMFTYERSVGYPHGHRNCMFAQRGVRTLPRLAEPEMDKRVAGIHADDTKMLYRYLKELDGICAVHTSATGMGTDWRDNDPQVEPIVEIYQGDRMSYEKEAAPRAGYDPKSGKEPGNVGGWYPKGFIDNALGKGYRLAFQSSSDHWSTHISYCIVMAERRDRQALLDAVKKRHVYGATDDIVLDVRSGPHIMGDEFTSTAAPSLDIIVHGTAPLARIDILRDSKVVHTLRPGKEFYQGQWTDPRPEAGVHYYYVRAHQTDNELAWGSPLWIHYRR